MLIFQIHSDHHIRRNFFIADFRRKFDGKLEENRLIDFLGIKKLLFVLGDDLVQNRQAAANEFQLFPLQFSGC